MPRRPDERDEPVRVLPDDAEPTVAPLRGALVGADVDGGEPQTSQ
jgi:hypothetical protein